jgi:hypothetical protein
MIHVVSTGLDNQRQDVLLPQIIQTNVTRFGTIIMIIFLVSIWRPSTATTCGSGHSTHCHERVLGC